MAISRVPAWAQSVIDWTIALGLAAAIQSEIWLGPPPAAAGWSRAAHAAL